MPVQLPAPRAVLFDWDSTLVDNWSAIGRALNLTFERMGRPTWTEAEIRLNTKNSLRDSFPKLFGEDRWEEAMRVFYASFEEVHLSTLRALPGAADLLDELTRRGLPVALVSNKTGRYLRREAEHLGWAPLFHRMVGATDAPRDKPAPDPVHMALEDSGIAAGPAVWFVGDSGADLACAHATGCTPILIHPARPHPEDLSAHPPAVQVDDCFALRSLFGD